MPMYAYIQLYYKHNFVYKMSLYFGLKIIEIHFIFIKSSDHIKLPSIVS